MYIQRSITFGCNTRVVSTQRRCAPLYMAPQRPKPRSSRQLNGQACNIQIPSKVTVPDAIPQSANSRISRTVTHAAEQTDVEAFDSQRTVSVKEAAFRLKKSPDAVYRWLRSGRLRGWQLGGARCTILVSEDSVTEQLRHSLGVRGRKPPQRWTGNTTTAAEHATAV